MKNDTVHMTKRVNFTAMESRDTTTLAGVPTQVSCQTRHRLTVPGCKY